MLAPSHLREKCREEAADIVQRHNSVIMSEKGPCRNEPILDLITELTALLLQLKCISDTEQNAYEVQVLHGSVAQVKGKLSPRNQQIFQACVEVHMKQIEVGLNQNNLTNMDKFLFGALTKM